MRVLGFLFLLLLAAGAGAYGGYTYRDTHGPIAGQDGNTPLTAADQTALTNWVQGLPQEVGSCVTIAALSGPSGTSDNLGTVDCASMITNAMAVDAPPPQVADRPEVRAVMGGLQQVSAAFAAKDRTALASSAKVEGTAALKLLRELGIAGSALSAAGQ